MIKNIELENLPGSEQPKKKPNYWPQSKPIPRIPEEVVFDQGKHQKRYTQVPKLLDAFCMLNKAQSEDPKQVYALDISQQELEFIIEDDLAMFTNLHTLNASENFLPFARLGLLPGLRKLVFSCNGLKSLDLDVEGRFEKLEHLELQSNHVDRAALIVLSTLPRLKYLDLTRNRIKLLHNDFHDLTNWKDKVIELLLPLQVAALQLDHIDKHPQELEIPVQNDSAASVDNHVNSTVASHYPETSSLVVHPHIMGFQNLETLILDHNQLGLANPATYWGVLAPLPQLRRLHMNHIGLRSLKSLTTQIDGGLDYDLILQTKSFIPKLDGFHQLQELSIAFNLIETMQDLFGFIHLPSLKKVYLEGNPVMKQIIPKHMLPKRKIAKIQSGELEYIDYMELLFKNFGVTIADQCYAVPISAIQPGMITVSPPTPPTRPKKTFLRDFLHNKINACNLQIIHTVSDVPSISKQERAKRRMYQFSDKDLEQIVKQGYIPPIKELMNLSKSKDPLLPSVEESTPIGEHQAESKPIEVHQSGELEAKQSEELELEVEQKIEQKTFMTAVDLVEYEESSGNDFEAWYAEYLNVPDIDVPLPSTITESVRQLKLALKNPSSIWRVSNHKLRPFAGKISHKNIAPVLPQDELEEMGELIKDIHSKLESMEQKLKSFE